MPWLVSKLHSLFVENDNADIAQLVECVLGKDEVTGSIPVVGSKNLISLGWQSEFQNLIKSKN